MKIITSVKIIQLFVLYLFVLSLTACNSDNSTTPSKKATVQIYVANEDDGTVSVIDGTDNKITATIEITPPGEAMQMAHNVQVAPNGKSVWVTGVPMTDGAMEYLIVIDPLTNKVIKHIQAGTMLHLAHVVFDSASNYTFVTCNESGKILQYDANTYSLIKIFDLKSDSKPHGLRYSNGKLFVANMGSKSMSVLDVVSGQNTEIMMGGVAVQTAVTPDGKFAFVSLYDTKEVVRFELQSGIITRIALPDRSQGPTQMYPSPDGKFLYICDQGNVLGQPSSNKVFVLDNSTLQISSTISVGNAAHGVVISKDGKSTYITNSSDNSVSVIEIASNTVKATISVGKKPNGISYWYETGGMP